MPVTWDERLISRPQAAAMTADWQFRFRHGLVECPACERGICDGTGLFTTDGLIAAVARHMVMQHGHSVNGVPGDGN